MTIELLSCPRCGGPASAYEDPHLDGAVMWWAECDRGCFRTGPFDARQEAIDWWNVRPTPPDRAALAARIVEGLTYPEPIDQARVEWVERLLRGRPHRPGRHYRLRFP